MRWKVTALILLAASFAAAADAPKQEVAKACRAHGIAGGLIVHLGCGEGKITATLRPSGSFRVHGLDSDPAEIAKARAYLAALGVYGPVSVDTYGGTHLPYADNLVNLVVVSGAGPHPPVKEILRVLAPRGVALLAKGTTVKPRPDDVDDWTHYFHTADGNAVSADRRIAPPTRLQWDGPPRWSRSHETDMSLTAAVAAGLRSINQFRSLAIGLLAAGARRVAWHGHEVPRGVGARCTRDDDTKANKVWLG